MSPPIGSARAGLVSQVGDAMPDSEVSRPADDVTNNADFNVGLEFEVSQDWPDFDAKISSNTATASDEKMVIQDDDGNDISTVDISNKSAGDVVTFSGVNLMKNNTYTVFNRSSNSRDYGKYDNPSFPYESSDGNLSITAGFVESTGRETDNVYAISAIGNL